MLNFVMTEHTRSIAAFQEYLPAKSLHEQPFILWIQAPYHDHFSNNTYRFKFNRCLEEVAKLHLNTFTLTLKRVWDTKNPNLFLRDAQRFTAEGLSTYWQAVDRTVRCFDSVMLKKQDKIKRKTLKSNQFGVDNRDSHDRFQWQNPKFNTLDPKDDKSFRQLPTPLRRWHSDL